MTTPTDWIGFFDADHDSSYEEDLDLGGTWLLDLVAAVDFLRRGDRNGLTVWDALEEASRWWAAERISAINGVPDPDLADLARADPDALHRSLTRLLDATALNPPCTAEVALQQAVRRWTSTMSSLHNESEPWLRPIRWRDP